MILDGADGEEGDADVGDGDGPAIDLVVTRGEGVVEEDPPQIFRVHAEGHAGRIGVPGREVIPGLALAEQVVAHQARPDQVVGAQQLEGPRHLLGVQVALIPHHVLEKGDLILVDEQQQLAGLGEVGLGRQQGEGAQAVVAIPGHGRGGDGQQGPPQAIADAMNPAPGQDLADGLQGRHDAQAAVVLQPQVTIGAGGVLPGKGEDRMALADQIADQGVARGQVEDVVLHDPGRDDEDGFGVDPLSGRLVLDELDEGIAIDHLAGGHRQVPPDDEGLPQAVRAVAQQQVLQVGEEVGPATEQILSPLPPGRLEDLRVGQGRVGGGEEVQELAGDEGDDGLVLFGNAAVVGGGDVPPLLGEQKRLVKEIEGPLLPGRCRKAGVLGQGVDAGWGGRVLKGAASVEGEA